MTPQKSADPASLDHLHGIVFPDPVPWWPPAAGWIFVGALAIVALGVVAGLLVVRWRRNRLRRAALAELAALEARLESDPPTVARHLATVLKLAEMRPLERPRITAVDGVEQNRWPIFGLELVFTEVSMLL